MMRRMWPLAMAMTACTYGSHLPEEHPRPVPPAIDAGIDRDTGVTPWEPPDLALPTIDAVSPRPAVAGGTLLVTSAQLVIAADPDRASVWVLDPAAPALRGRIALEPDDEPGRLVEDGAGRVHVVLRRAGAIATIDLAGPRVLERRAVCPAPRGIDWDADRDALHVACAGGELVTLPASGGPATRSIVVEPDLRDVIAGDGVLYVSRFRSAELLTIDTETGTLLARRAPPARTATGRTPMELHPNTAWRIRTSSDGGIVMLHQESVSSTVEVEMGGYGGGPCRNGIVSPSVSVFPSDGGPATGGGAVMMTPLSVDLAATPDGTSFVLAVPSLAPRGGGGIARVYAGTLDGECVGDPPDSAVPPTSAVEHMADGRLVSLTSDPLRIAIGPTVFGGSPLPPDRGHALFHEGTLAFVACASCHPEGADDGHTWDFAGTGPRRTQSLTGGLLATAPFHWAGDQPDMTSIMIATFTQRMGGGDLGAGDVDAISSWLDTVPAVPGSIGEGAARGRALFEDAAVGCAGCHSGAALTNNANADVGRGGAFQVPSLRGVGPRAPYFHDGCAQSLEAVVSGDCGTLDRHGRTSHLDAAQRADLVLYLRSL